MMKLPTFLYKPLNLFFFFFITYTLISFVPKSAGMTLTNGDEPHYLVMTYNLIHKGNLDHLEDVYKQKIFASWYGADVLEGHLMGFNNKLYAYHQIGLAILMIPGFAVGGLMGAVIMLTFFAALGSMCLYKVLQYYVDRDFSLLMTLLVGLTVPVATYANLVYPETVIYFFVSWMMMIILHKNFKFNLFNIILLTALLIYLPIFHIKFVVLSIMFLIYLNVTKFKKELIPLIVLDVLFIVGFSSYFYWFNSYYDWQLSSALSGIAAGTSLSLLRIPSGILGITVDRENGIFIYSPYYIYILYSFIPVIKKAWPQSFYKRLHILFPLYLAAGFTAFFTMFPYVIGGASPSGRYSLPVIPAMAILVAIGFKQKLKTPIQKKIIALFSIYSLLIAAMLFINPILAIPANMENKVFFWIFKGYAHRLINVYLPNLSQFYRIIPLIDYIKAIGVFGILVILTQLGNFKKKSYK